MPPKAASNTEVSRTINCEYYHLLSIFSLWYMKLILYCLWVLLFLSTVYLYSIYTLFVISVFGIAMPCDYWFSDCLFISYVAHILHYTLTRALFVCITKSLTDQLTQMQYIVNLSLRLTNLYAPLFDLFLSVSHFVTYWLTIYIYIDLYAYILPRV